MPSFVMSIPIAENKAITNRAVKDRTDVGLETPWAGGGRRRVDVEDGERRFVDDGGYSLDFDDVVVDDAGCIDGRVGD